MKLSQMSVQPKGETHMSKAMGTNQENCAVTLFMNCVKEEDYIPSEPF